MREEFIMQETKSIYYKRLDLSMLKLIHLFLKGQKVKRQAIYWEKKFETHLTKNILYISKIYQEKDNQSNRKLSKTFKQTLHWRGNQNSQTT